MLIVAYSMMIAGMTDIHDALIVFLAVVSEILIQYTTKWIATYSFTNIIDGRFFTNY